MNDFEQKMALLNKRLKANENLFLKRAEQKQRELSTQNESKALNSVFNKEEALEVIRLKHELDPEVRERGRGDKVFYENIDLQAYLKRSEADTENSLKIIRETALYEILKKVTDYRAKKKLFLQKESARGNERIHEKKIAVLSHELEKDRMTHETDEKIRFAYAMAELKRKFGDLTKEEIFNLINAHKKEWEAEINGE